MKKIILSVLALIVALMSTVVAVFGWLAVGTQIEPNYTGSVVSNYFASGNGSEGDAFIINRPNHLYNLAWLQNNGYFGSNQYYFKITADLDMSGYVLPPIGTKDNPFIGILDGKIDDGTDDGKICTIYNLTVSNVISDSSKPNEVSRVPKVYNENAIGDGDTDIVGFFGVIGHHPDSTCNAKTLTNKVSVSNLYLDNLTVRTRTSNTLIGLFAGYVCGNVSDIGVCRSLVSIGSEAKVLNENYSNHSNYSLIGDYHKASTGWAATDTGSSGGEEGAGFGGSIDMKLLSRRVGYMITSMLAHADAYANTSSAYQVTFDEDSIASVRNYYKDEGSSYNLNIYKNRSSNITSIPEGAFYYKNAALTSTSNKYVDCGLLYQTYLPLNIDLEEMHLTEGYNEVAESSLAAIEGTYYYNDIYRDGIKEGENYIRKEVASASNTGYIVGGGVNSITIQVTLRVSPLNYGSGLSSNYLAGTIYKSLRYDITSSSPYKYTRDGAESTINYSDDVLDLATNVDGTFYRIVDKYNVYDKNTEGAIAPVLSYNELLSEKLKRYDSVRAQFGALLKENLIYGLQFKKVPSKDATIQGEVTIKNKNGTSTYSNYALIQSSINFNLSQSGYMTTILGGYGAMTYNQGGFSLYEVTRSSDNKTISTFEEITSVWLNDNAGTNIKDSDILYNQTENNDGKYTDENEITYTKVYDSSWYNGAIAPGVAYYVEIPLKSGDYCLGGAGLSYSAYLMYLDIGANGSSSGSSGSETDTDYKIDNVRFVYNSITTGFDFKSLETLYMFQIVYQNGSNGVHVYFLMTSSEMCYYVTIDTENTQVKLTNESLSATNSVDLSDGYGGTKEAPS